MDRFRRTFQKNTYSYHFPLTLLVLISSKKKRSVVRMPSQEDLSGNAKDFILEKLSAKIYIVIPEEC